MSEVIEEWRPFDTGNYVNPNYDVSSLGRVRKISTGEILELEDKANSIVSPHYCVDKTWWLPVVLIRVIFSREVKIPVKIEKFEASQVDGEIVENFTFPAKRKKQAAKESSMIVRHPSKASVSVPETPLLQPEVVEARSAEVELAQILYKPRPASEKNSEPIVEQVQTAQDRMAQRVSTNRTQTVHGVDRVLKLYKTSAFKRGYAWELTDEKAIGLMVLPCHYCGCEPGTHNQNGLNGIDRIINADGYVQGNVVPCCGKCNMMKGQRAPDEFIGHVFSIAEYQREALAKVEA